jgi:hypothetical protein
VSYIDELTLKHCVAGTAAIESGALIEACAEVDRLRALIFEYVQASCANHPPERVQAAWEAILKEASMLLVRK